MPAVSKKQQRFMGIVHAIQKGEATGSAKARQAAKTMKKKDVTDFATTKTKGLPLKKKGDIMNKQAFEQGFVDRCAQYGVNPEAVVQYMEKAGADGKPDYTGTENRPVGQDGRPPGANQPAEKKEAPPVKKKEEEPSTASKVTKKVQSTATEHPTASAAVGGGVLGAGAGALIGGMTGKKKGRGMRAFLGALMGAGAGAGIGAGAVEAPGAIQRFSNAGPSAGIGDRLHNMMNPGHLGGNTNMPPDPIQGTVADPNYLVNMISGRNIGQ